MNALFHICAGFGLSGAAGLRAYLPLLAVGLLARFGFIHLPATYELLSAPWVLIVLGVLCIVELLADKIPLLDNVCHIAQFVVAPAAGALLFASQAGAITYVHPGVWLVLGLLCALSVHTVKATARPVVHATTAGFASPFVSLVEDFVSLVLTVLAIVAPIIGAILLLVILFVFYKIARGLHRKFLAKSPSYAQSA